MRRLSISPILCQKLPARMLFMMAAVLLLGIEPTAAQGKLPSGASFRLRELDRILAKGERVMGAESAHLSTDYRFKTAMAAVEEGRAKMEEIRDRFGDQIPADNAEMKAADDRINALEASANVLQSGEAQQAAAAQASSAEREAASADWLARLKPYVVPIGRPDHSPDRYLIPSAMHASTIPGTCSGARNTFTKSIGCGTLAKSA